MESKILASVAKLHILPSLALKLQGHNKNKFRSVTCSGSQARGTWAVAGRPPWARVEQGYPDGQADIHREHRARLEGPPAGRQGAAAGGQEEGPASSGWHPEVLGLRAMQCGSVLPREGEEQGWGMREWVQAGAFCRPSLVTRAWLAPRPLRSTGAAPGSWPHLATTTKVKGEELLRERDAGGGEEAGRGGPRRAAPRQALQLWQGSL